MIQKKEGKALTSDQVYNKVMTRARSYITQIQADMRPAAIRPTLWMFNKIWQRIYDQIVVNESGLNQLRELIAAKKDNIVLLPVHKSYVDFILIAYIHFHYKLDFPYTCGDEVLHNITLISYLLKSGGGFFNNTQLHRDDLYSAVLDAYICALMKNNCLLSIFLEKKRSRSGKI